MATGETKPKKRVAMRPLCEQCKKCKWWTWKGSYVRRPEAILISSAERGHPDCVEICLRAGADVNKHFDDFYSGGTTALMKTSENGHLQCVELLLKEGADVNAWNESGYTALICAAGNEHASVVNVLIGAGADVSNRNCGGLTSLIHAVQCGRDVCVNLLIKSGADVNKEMGGETALMIAVTLGHERCINILLKAGADVNSADYDGNTLLHKAMDVYGKRNDELCSTILKVIRAVLQSGARVNVLNRSHLTPLGYYYSERNGRLGAFAGFE